MPKVTYRYPDGVARTIDVEVGDSVMFGATRNGLGGITAECGGVLSCATCHVYVDQAWCARVGPPGDDELDMLDAVAAERRDNSRLSCQIEVSDELDGLVVELPDAQ